MRQGAARRGTDELDGLRPGPMLRRRQLLRAFASVGLAAGAAPVLSACSSAVATGRTSTAPSVAQQTASTAAAATPSATLAAVTSLPSAVTADTTSSLVAPAAKPVAANGPKIRISEWDIPPEPFGVWLNSYLRAFTAQTGIQLEILLKNPGIPVDQEQDTWVASGDVPDVFYRNSRGAAIFAAYAVKKVIQPLSPFVARDKFDLSDFWPDAIRVLSGQGKLWVMPQDFNVPIWAYNVTEFQGAGLPLPLPPGRIPRGPGIRTCAPRNRCSSI